MRVPGQPVAKWMEWLLFSFFVAYVLATSQPLRDQVWDWIEHPPFLYFVLVYLFIFVGIIRGLNRIWQWLEGPHGKG